MEFVQPLTGSLINITELTPPMPGPQPIEQPFDDTPLVAGKFWTKSCLWSDGLSVKTMIYTLSVLAALILLAAGMGVIKGQIRATVVWLASAGLALLVLIVFWNVYWITGIVIEFMRLVATLCIRGFVMTRHPHLF